MESDYSGSGHVFVVHGDLSKLSCDAWMLPTDDKLSIESTWGVSEWLHTPIAPPKEWGNEGTRILRVLDLQEWPESRPLPYIVNVGGIKLPICALCESTGATTYCEQDKIKLCYTCDLQVHSANKIAQRHKREATKDIEWYIEGARLFFETVHADFQHKSPVNGRERPLVALPLIGTGKGGAEKSAGGMVVALLKELHLATQKYCFDVALVTIKKSMFAAIQVQRSRVAEDQNLWHVLPERLKLEAERLARIAREGGLVLFLGSGVSSGAGLPTWPSLLSDLAKQGGMTETEIKALLQMNFLDAARVIEIKLGGSKNLTSAVAARVTVHSYSLVCGLLAGICVREVITTNYNRMYELACSSIGLHLAVLPYAPASQCDRWILKLHGCVSHPDDIVLTREHYMRYSTTRSALSGIVQSLLITRHMLFVGFSLNDDNFHKIIDEVRRSVRKSEGSTSENETVNRFGTQLSLSENSITKILWAQDVDVISMAETDAPTTERERKRQARILEIFLDYVLSLATTTTRFLMNVQYDALLEEGQRALRNKLDELLATMPPLAQEAPEYALLIKLLADMGWKKHRKASLDTDSTTGVESPLFSSPQTSPMPYSPHHKKVYSPYLSQSVGEDST